MKRMEDCIHRKSETDVIDIKSGIEILENIFDLDVFEMQTLIRIFEMIDSRLMHESNL